MGKVARQTAEVATAEEKRARAVPLLAQLRERADERTLYRVVVVASILTLAGAGIWNAYKIPSVNGYDAWRHQEYARALIEDGQLSAVTGSAYKPPGFYAVAGTVHEVGEALDWEERYKPMQYVNVAFTVAAAALVLALARLLWPTRPWLQLSALVFFVLVPPVIKTTWMYHPGPLALLLSAAGLYLGARMLVRRSFGVRSALPLAVVLVLGLAVMPHLLWTYAAVVAALLAAALAGYAPRRAVLRAVLVVFATTALVAGPVYVTQAVRQSKPLLGLPLPSAERFWESREGSFYTDLGYPEVFSEPYRPHFTNRLFPTAYTELWGDYFGIYAWGALTPPVGAVKDELRQQSVLGLLPTGLALAGWLAFLVSTFSRSTLREEPVRLTVALLPALGLLAFLFYAIGYPSVDGDTIKATYMLTAAPAWALAFALAAGRLARYRALRPALVFVLVGTAFLDLRFLVVGGPLWGLL